MSSNARPTRDTPEATVERFWAMVDRRSPVECWEWRGSLKRSKTGGGTGYGQFSLGHRLPIPAHRFAYEQTIGPIPAGLQLDHLCSNRACVNPGHLEPVTAGENSRRAMSGRRALLCRNGHPLTPDNEIMFGGVRRCHICSILKTRRAYRRRKGLPADYPVRQ